MVVATDGQPDAKRLRVLRVLPGCAAGVRGGDEGGRVIGVIPEALTRKEVAHDGFYYTGLERFLGGAVRERFVSPAHRGMLLTDADPGSLLDRLGSYEAPAVDKWIDRSAST